MLPIAMAVATSPVMNQAMMAVVVVATTRQERAFRKLLRYDSRYSGSSDSIFLLFVGPLLCEGLDLSASWLRHSGRDDGGGRFASTASRDDPGSRGDGAFDSRHFDWRRSRNGEISFRDLSVEALAPQVEMTEGGRDDEGGLDDGELEIAFLFFLLHRARAVCIDCPALAFAGSGF